MTALFTSIVIAFDPSTFTTSDPKPWGFFVNNTIYKPTGNESVTYPRYTEVEDGTLIATTWLRGPAPGYQPIFESKDGGATWKHISNLNSIDGLGINNHPALTVLTEAMGGYAAGTILTSGNVWGTNFTRIDLYASKDTGRTWEFVSHIAQGQAAGSNKAIWEPYLL